MNPSGAFIMRCKNCGTKNRIPSDKVGDTAKCGKCGNSFRTDELKIAEAVVVSDSSFDNGVLKSALPVLLDCWAPWCGPCKMVGPMMDELAKEWKGRIRVCKLNVDENPVTASKFQISSIPTLLIFDNGQLKDTLVGAVPKNAIIQKVTAYL